MAAVWPIDDDVRSVLAQRNVGVSVSPEGLEHGFRHVFSIDFDDAAARDAYLEHSEHKTLGGQLVGLLEGGVAGLVVFDLVVE